MVIENRYTGRRGYYIQLSKEAGLINLGRATVFRLEARRQPVGWG